MIASAGTRLTRPSGGEGTRDQGGRGAALQQGGQADAGGKGGEAVVQRLRQQPPQIGTERAQNSAVDHVQAPQQQRHAAHQVEKNHASHDRPLPKFESKDQAIAKRRRINPLLFRRGARKCDVAATVDVRRHRSCRAVEPGRSSGDNRSTCRRQEPAIHDSLARHFEHGSEEFGTRIREQVDCEISAQPVPIVSLNCDRGISDLAA